MKSVRLKSWEWLFLFLIGFLFPVYNILINSFLMSLKFELSFYSILMISTTVFFSSILFLTFNLFRKKTNFERRIDTAFVLYVLAVSFGSFFNNSIVGFWLFVVPFLMVYFFEIKSILYDFPRE